MGTPKKKYNVPTLEDRISALHSEIDDLVSAYVDDLKRAHPSIPRGVLEQNLLAGAPHGCKCKALPLVRNE